MDGLELDVDWGVDELDCVVDDVDVDELVVDELDGVVDGLGIDNTASPMLML